MEYKRICALVTVVYPRNKASYKHAAGAYGVDFSGQHAEPKTRRTAECTTYVNFRITDTSNVDETLCPVSTRVDDFTNA